MKRAYIPAGCDQQGRLNPTIRRHPRTMAEAFGPYTSNQLAPMPKRRDRDDALVTTVCVIGFAVLLAFYGLGWI